MSIFRNVAFIRSEDGGIWAIHSHGNQEFDPDRHADYLPANQYGCSINRKTDTLIITDIRNGNRYISEKGCNKIQG